MTADQRERAYHRAAAAGAFERFDLGLGLRQFMEGETNPPREPRAFPRRTHAEAGLLEECDSKRGLQFACGAVNARLREPFRAGRLAEIAELHYGDQGIQLPRTNESSEI